MLEYIHLKDVTLPTTYEMSNIYRSVFLLLRCKSQQKFEEEIYDRLFDKKMDPPPSPIYLF